MAKHSMKMGGKEVGPASVYAKPHTMHSDDTEQMGRATPVTAGKQNQEKTNGIKMRGTGAATKGVMSRGPMG